MKEIMETKAIYFDMDGTIADLYAVEGWLDDIINGDVRPYAIAKPMLNMSLLARILNKLQSMGYKIGIVSWLSKSGTEEYNNRVAMAKIQWLRKHLASVKFDEVSIVKYGTCKSDVVKEKGGILFDDEERNRTAWLGKAFDANNILEVLKEIA